MRELPSLLNNMVSHSNDDHNDTFPIVATRWQVLKEVHLDLTCTGAEILWQHTHAGAQGTLLFVFSFRIVLPNFNLEKRRKRTHAEFSGHLVKRWRH